MKASVEVLLPPAGESFRCFNRAGLNQPAKWHRHPEVELTYVERGTGTRLVGDNIATYRDHDLVLIGPNLPHTWQSDEYLGRKYDRHPAVVVQFHPQFLGTGFLEAPEMSCLRGLLKSAERGLWYPPHFAQTIGNRLTRMTTEPGPLRLIHLLECLLQLSSCTEAISLSSPGFAPELNEHTETRTERICYFISQRFRDPNLTHNLLASQAKMNPSAFSRFFRKTTGKTVTEYVNEMRVGLACRLLMDTDLGVRQICLESGFSNLSNFNRRFREQRGMTPREYRQRHATMVDVPE